MCFFIDLHGVLLRLQHLAEPAICCRRCRPRPRRRPRRTRRPRRRPVRHILHLLLWEGRSDESREYNFFKAYLLYIFSLIKLHISNSNSHFSEPDCGHLAVHWHAGRDVDRADRDAQEHGRAVDGGGGGGRHGNARQQGVAAVQVKYSNSKSIVFVRRKMNLTWEIVFRVSDIDPEFARRFRDNQQY